MGSRSRKVNEKGVAIEQAQDIEGRSSAGGKVKRFIEWRTGRTWWLIRSGRSRCQVTPKGSGLDTLIATQGLSGKDWQEEDNDWFFVLDQSCLRCLETSRWRCHGHKTRCSGAEKSELVTCLWEPSTEMMVVGLGTDEISQIECTEWRKAKGKAACKNLVIKADGLSRSCEEHGESQKKGAPKPAGERVYQRRREQQPRGKNAGTKWKSVHVFWQLGGYWWLCNEQFPGVICRRWITERWGEGI